MSRRGRKVTVLEVGDYRVLDVYAGGRSQRYSLERRIGDEYREQGTFRTWAAVTRFFARLGLWQPSMLKRPETDWSRYEKPKNAEQEDMWWEHARSR